MEHRGVPKSRGANIQQTKYFLPASMDSEGQKVETTYVDEKSASAGTNGEDFIVIDGETGRKLLRRIDKRVMPVVSIDNRLLATHNKLD